jgi:hypothetical protein
MGHHLITSDTSGNVKPDLKKVENILLPICAPMN